MRKSPSWLFLWLDVSSTCNTRQHCMWTSLNYFTLPPSSAVQWSALLLQCCTYVSQFKSWPSEHYPGSGFFMVFQSLCIMSEQHFNLGHCHRFVHASTFIIHSSFYLIQHYKIDEPENKLRYICNVVTILVHSFPYFQYLKNPQLQKKCTGHK
jgi:hypothetical protein